MTADEGVPTDRPAPPASPDRPAPPAAPGPDRPAPPASTRPRLRRGPGRRAQTGPPGRPGETGPSGQPGRTETGPSGRPGQEQVGLLTIVGQWGRLGCIGFGGPPTHIALLRKMCVNERAWMDATEFEDAVATTNLLPGPASTQLAIYCAWRLRGAVGAIVGGVGFIVPGLVVILALAAAFLQARPPEVIAGLAAGAGAAVPAVAISAAWGFVPASWKRIGPATAQHVRWVVYAAAGGTAAALVGEYLVLVLLACGGVEVLVRRAVTRPAGAPVLALPAVVVHVAVAVGGIGAVVWEAFKVGALSYGGGFVIIPLMQHDVVKTYHWMTGAQFLDAVALGQITPGPVVQTVAVVGYAARGVGGGLLAALVAFTPSFLFVLIGGSRFGRIRANADIDGFLSGAGPAVIGAIAGSAIPLGLALGHLWQIPVLAAALVWLLVLRRGAVVAGLLAAGAVGMAVALSGVPV